MVKSDCSGLVSRSSKLILVQCDICCVEDEIKFSNYYRGGFKWSEWLCRSCKTKSTNLKKWGVENPSQSMEIKNKKKVIWLEKWGVDHPSKSDIIKKKKIETFMEKWGVKNPFQLEEIKEIIKETNLNKLGVENPSQSDSIKSKKMKTSLENWGVDHPLKSEEIKEKVNKSNLEKFGVEWTLQSPKIKEKIKITNLERWGFENPMMSSILKESIKVSNIEKWGVEWFYQTDEFRKKSKDSLLKNWNVDSPLKSPIIKHKANSTNLKKWGNSEYLKTFDFRKKSNKTLLEKWQSNTIQKSDLFREGRFKITKDDNYVKYIDNKLSLFRCDNLLNHEFEISSDNYLQRVKNNIPLCTICNPIGDLKSIKEKELFQFIQSIYDGEIIQSWRSGLEIDIYLPHLNLGFEFNGLYWHSDKFKDKSYHLNKTKHFEVLCIRIIHIWEDDWNFRKSIIESQVKNLIKKTQNRIFARKCEVYELSTVSKFLNTNHIQGTDYSKVKLGLTFEGDLVSVMTFNKLEGRKSMVEGEWNLSRFCNKMDHNVIGGASKLLNYFIKNWCVKRVISYADRDWSRGNLYDNLGFKKVNESLPDYKYLVGDIRVHKSRFKKSITGISESKLDFLKIWDCGKLKYEKII